jgi:beta-lactamase class A
MRTFFSSHRNIFYSVVFLVAGALVGCGVTVFALGRSANPSGAPGTSIQELRKKGYQFVSPLLVANPSNEFVPFENKLKQGVFNYLDNSDVHTISIYFQDLNSGQWAGVDENNTYNPASMLKVPFMVAYFKEAETNPAILSEEFTYRADPADGTSTEFDTLTPGQNYSVDDLIQAMIVDSDNGAKYTLLQHIDQKILLSTFTDLGIQTPDVPNYTISDKAYARFFKILYNATYLDADMSEKAMELLNETTFKDGIVAGVPAGVPVAHKFGQYASSNGTASSSNAWELGDCGVVYYPSKPYLLCVMTRGANLNSLAPILRAVSQIAYSEVDGNYQ